jgi:hypothetical protein
MNPTYKFYFFNPRRAATQIEILAALQALQRSGSRVDGFDRGDEYVRSQPGATINAQDLIVEGEVSADLSVATPAGQTLDYTIMIHVREANGEFARLSVEEPYLAQDPSAVSVLLELAKTLNVHLPAWFAWGDHELNLDELESDLSLERVSALAWANLFGRGFIDRVGETFLTQAPAYQTLSFKQGLLYALSPSPLVKPDPALLRRVETYFGIRAISRGK